MFKKAPQEREKCYRCDRELAERSFEASLMRKGLVNLDYDVPWRDVTTTEDTKEICEDSEKVLRRCSFSRADRQLCDTRAICGHTVLPFIARNPLLPAATGEPRTREGSAGDVSFVENALFPDGALAEIQKAPNQRVDEYFCHAASSPSDFDAGQRSEAALVTLTLGGGTPRIS